MHNARFTMNTSWQGAVLAMALCLSAALPQLAAAAKKPVPDKTVNYKKVNGTTLRMQVFLPPDHRPTDQRPAVVFFFGGGWAGGTTRQFYQQARWLTRHGIVGISAEYRVRSKHKATPFECVKDGKSAIRWVRQHADQLGIDPDQIIAAGGSAGGHVAACTGTISGYEEEGEDLTISSVPNGMILFNPVLDTTKTGFGRDRVGPDRDTEISPCHHVTATTPPTLIMHGTSDSVVPFENAQRFTRLMKEAGAECTLVPFEGSDHGFFNGSFFRPKNNDDNCAATMKHSLTFVQNHMPPICGILPFDTDAGSPSSSPPSE